MAPGASFYMFHAIMMSFSVFTAFKIVKSFSPKQVLIWNKDTLAMSRSDYQWKQEPCLYGWKLGAKHTWNTDRKQTTVLDYARPKASKEHPTMKPVELITYLVKNSTKKEDIVLDIPFDPFWDDFEPAQLDWAVRGMNRLSKYSWFSYPHQYFSLNLQIQQLHSGVI